MTVEPATVFALAWAAGVAGHLLARPLRAPPIVVLLGLGILLGPDGLAWIAPRSLGEGLFPIVELGVAVILFEGGLNLDLRRLRREGGPIRNLVSIGAVTTAAGAALAAHLFMAWPAELCVIFGTLVIVTGPTVIGPLLRHARIRPRVATVLEAEGVLIDPIGAIVAAVVLPIVVGEAEHWSPGLGQLLLRLGVGTAAGLFFGFALARFLRLRRAYPEGLENLIALGGALLLFAVSNLVVSQTGILAVVVAGVVVGNSQTRVTRELREFQEHLTIGTIGLLFILLAADVRFYDLMALGWAGIAVVAVLIGVVRPAGVLLSTAGSTLSWRERSFLCWVAPRGIVAAAIASLFTAVMEESGLEGASALRGLVFLTIATTVVLQGISIGPVARLLGVAAPAREAIAILGADALARTVAAVFRDAGARVVLLDSNPTHIRAAEEEGLTAVYGNALEGRTLARARLDHAEIAIGLSSNDEVNAIFTREASEQFAVPRRYVAVRRRETRITPERLARLQSRVLFDGPKDVVRWSVRVRHGDTRLAVYRYREEAAPGEETAPEALPAGRNPDPYVILTVERGGSHRPMYEALRPAAGDRVTVLLHTAEEELAEARLSALGYERE